MRDEETPVEKLSGVSWLIGGGWDGADGTDGGGAWLPLPLNLRRLSRFAVLSVFWGGGFRGPPKVLIMPGGNCELWKPTGGVGAGGSAA